MDTRDSRSAKHHDTRWKWVAHWAPIWIKGFAASIVIGLVEIIADGTVWHGSARRQSQLRPRIGKGTKAER